MAIEGRRRRPLWIFAMLIGCYRPIAELAGLQKRPFNIVLTGAMRFNRAASSNGKGRDAGLEIILVHSFLSSSHLVPLLSIFRALSSHTSVFQNRLSYHSM